MFSIPESYQVRQTQVTGRVLNSKTKKTRQKAYKDLLNVTRKTINYAKAAVGELQRFRPIDLPGVAVTIGMKMELDEYKLRVI